MTVNHKICIAPMLGWTDRHDRYFLRLISRNVVLYTEMVTTGALINANREQLLRFDDSEHPLALQLGGSDPTAMALCARIAEDAGYDEVNINVGCPSDRVQNGAFGACLMATPEVVAECFTAMQDAVEIPVTVKHRIGIDHQDEQRDLDNFVAQVSAAGCRTFIVHARKAWLQGLSPKENRDIPPLNYNRVYALKAANPELEFVINGGITTLAETESHLQQVDGVMIGREAYHSPYMLAEVDKRFFAADGDVPSRGEIIAEMSEYILAELQAGTRLSHITRHMLGLYRGCNGARHWRRIMSEQARAEDAGLEVLAAAGEVVEE